MKNISLKSDLKTILEEPGNINKISKGGVSNFSIEIEFIMPPTFSSYVYYDKEALRDEDLKELQELISKKK
jgi:hypothetical protein